MKDNNDDLHLERAYRTPQPRSSNYKRRTVDGWPVIDRVNAKGSIKSKETGQVTKGPNVVKSTDGFIKLSSNQLNLGKLGHKKEAPFTKNIDKRQRPPDVSSQNINSISQNISNSKNNSDIRSYSLTKRRLRKVWLRAIFILATILLLLGLALAINNWRLNKQAEADVSHGGSVTSTDDPDDLPPSTDKPSNSAVASYKTAPDMPRYFKMPEFNVNARVFPMGLNKKGAVETPRNVYDVGWYDASSKPGENGAVLLDAHLSSWTTKGVFYKLKSLKVGDLVSIERGDGKVFDYKVVTTKSYDKDRVDMRSAMLPITEGKNGLNMITCDGKVIPGTNDFDKRLIVFTEQVN